MKRVRLSGHALRNIAYRGATEEEVTEAVHTTPWTTGELGRVECRKDFSYGREWNGKFYASKQVRPIFVEEAEEIVVVTVYVYYF